MRPPGHESIDLLHGRPRLARIYPLQQKPIPSGTDWEYKMTAARGQPSGGRGQGSWSVSGGTKGGNDSMTGPLRQIPFYPTSAAPR